MATLTRNDFVRILRKFADSPEDVLDDRSMVTCSINGDYISVSVFEQDDVLMCKEEGGRQEKARIWIERRVAKLDSLAKKISEVLNLDSHFVDVGAQFDGVEEGWTHEKSVTNSILDRIAKRSNYATEVLYLLSEAGDGKSAVMNRVAALSAARYCQTGSGPIVLPISLDGRPFLRIDDLVIGILANQFRFRYFYFEGLLELIKMGSIVLGLDGFEEMVVEGKEDRVISSLGELLKSFDSSGRVLISARRAFYEYALRKQLPLLDSIQTINVDCDAYRLVQWGREEFESLLDTYPVLRNQKGVIYEKLAEKLKQDHPILVRPVLARKLVETLNARRDAESLDDITSNLTSDKNPQTVMKEFVGFLVQREANYKWVSTSGPSKGAPILSIDEHMSVLSAIAEDMWVSGVEYVKQDYLQEWMGLVCAELGKSPSETNDAREKILHHAILLRENERYGFCHEAFRKYFLGHDIATYIVKNDSSYGFERVLSQDVFDVTVAESAAYELAVRKIPYARVAALLMKVKGGTAKLSAIGQNVGTLLLSYARYVKPEATVEIRDVFFTKAASKGVLVDNLHFLNCSFEEMDLQNGNEMQNVEVSGCIIGSLVLHAHQPKMEGVNIDEGSTPQNVVICTDDDSDESNVIYDPAKVRELLVTFGVLKEVCNKDAKFSIGIDRDERMSTLISLSIILKRTSGLSDRALEVRFGKKWHMVNNELLPLYVKDGILKRRDWYGGGGNERFSLNVPVSKFEEARRRSDGRYESFVKVLKGL